MLRPFGPSGVAMLITLSTYFIDHPSRSTKMLRRIPRTILGICGHPFGWAFDVAASINSFWVVDLTCMRVWELEVTHGGETLDGRCSFSEP